ncbi:pali-domain-containing protein [Hypoxylon sp. NC0597]|nr:pali-domain-containing protein [Hypoxylon sp. NC0597]
MAATSRFFNAMGKMFTSRISRIFTLFLVAAAFALLVVVDVTAPVNNGLALFTARNKYIRYNEGYPVIRFGTFGYCLQIYRDFSESYYSSRDPTADKCSSPSIGYSPSEAIAPISDIGSSDQPGEAGLTKAMILHPLATTFSFLILVSSMFPRELVPSVVSPLLSSLTTLLALVALICDLVLFSRVESMLEGAADTAFGSFDTGMWLLLIAVICLVFSTVFLAGRWWFGRRLGSTKQVAPDAFARVGAGMEQEQEQEEGKTDRSSSAPVSPYEMDLGSKGGCAELSQGPHADCHELNSDDRGRVELEHQDRRFELPV